MNLQLETLISNIFRDSNSGKSSILKLLLNSMISITNSSNWYLQLAVESRLVFVGKKKANVDQNAQNVKNIFVFFKLFYSQRKPGVGPSS